MGGMLVFLYFAPQFFIVFSKIIRLRFKHFFLRLKKRYLRRKRSTFSVMSLVFSFSSNKT
jgi:hypothetical protein